MSSDYIRGKMEYKKHLCNVLAYGKYCPTHIGINKELCTSKEANMMNRDVCCECWKLALEVLDEEPEHE